MNTNQFATLIKYTEKNDWHNLCQHFSHENQESNYENKIQIIKELHKKFNSLQLNQNQKNNAIKWLMNEISISFIISEEKEYYARKLVEEWLEFLNSEQLITIVKLFWQEGNLEYVEKATIKLWSMSPCLSGKVKEKDIEEIILQTKDPILSYMALSYAIDVGDQILAKKFYQIFYKFYFDRYDLEDEKNIYWDMLWSKLSLITENWATWEMLKLDVGFITDIIIKNKTKLKIPHFRKKRDLSMAILLRGQWETFNSTLLKYLECIETSNMVYQWIDIILESKVKLDIDSEQICLKLKLSKPKIIPIEQSKFYDDTINSTQIFTQDTQVNYNADFRDINIKLEKAENEILKKSNVDLQKMFNLNSKIHWKDKINMLMLHQDFKAVIKLIDENIETLSGEEKISFEIFNLEILLKMGECHEVLEKIESLWKGVQELEVFKMYKYLEGEALWALNRKKEAIDCYRKVVDIDPSYKLAKWRLIEYNA